MDRQTFIRTIAIGAAAGAVVPDDLEAEDLEVGVGIGGIGPDDILILRFSVAVELSAEFEGELSEKLRRLTGCKEVIVAQGLEGIDVIGPASS